jgi:hypothetical protein
MRLCESERNYRAMEHNGSIKMAVGGYGLGSRSPALLNTLASARVWSEHIGEWVPVPAGYDRLTWTDILDTLVLRCLGTHRCLDCSAFFRRSGPSNPPTQHCPSCGSTVNEIIGCTKGVHDGTT